MTQANEELARQGDGNDGTPETTGGITPITPMPPIDSNGNDGTTMPPEVVTPPEVVIPPVEIELALRKIASEVAYATGMATGNAHDLFLDKLSPERQRRIAELALSDTPGRHALIREIIVEHNCDRSAEQRREAKPRVEKG